MFKSSDNSQNQSKAVSMYRLVGSLVKDKHLRSFKRNETKLDLSSSNTCSETCACDRCSLNEDPA